MLPAIKILIIAIVVVGVAAPTGYFTVQYLSTPNPEMNHFIPDNSTSVISYNVNGTNAIVFSGTHFAGVIINYNLTQLEHLNTTNRSSSITNASINFKIAFNTTYEGIEIYKFSELYLSSLNNLNVSNSSLTVPTNIFVAVIGNSFVIVGNLHSVELSINANSSGKYLKKLGSFVNNKIGEISFYLNFSSSSILNESISSNFHLNNSLNTNIIVYGNSSAYYTNVTFISSNNSLLHNISLLTNVLPSNMTLSTSLNLNSHFFTAYLNVGYKNIGYVIDRLLSTSSKTGSSS